MLFLHIPVFNYSSRIREKAACDGWIRDPCRRLTFDAIYDVYGCFVKQAAQDCTEVEAPKVIIHTGRWRGLLKCAVHLPALLATVVLTALNCATYYMGSQYLGNSGGKWQGFDNLALQIAAKLYELFIIASLGTVLMDALRCELLRSSSGLPLGILTAKTRFADATFLFSPDFHRGITGLPRRKAIGIGLLIIVCSILALLAGPTSALLMRPETYDDWPAGAAKFFLVGKGQSIWPSQLDGKSVGGAHCQSATESILNLQLLNMSSCIWMGYSNILQFITSTHYARGEDAMLINDGLVERNMQMRGEYAYAVHVPTCLYSEVLSEIWYNAMFNAPSAQPGTLQTFANLRYRDRGGNVMTMPSQILMVRTNCFVNSSITFASVINETYYPLQPLNGKPATMGERYRFNSTNPPSRSSRISSIWLETPDEEPIGTSVNGDDVTGRSSVYLNVQIPSPNDTMGTLASCSIDARWLPAKISGTGGFGIGGRVTYEADHSVVWANPITFPDLYGDMGRSVRLKRDWLNTLTPRFGNVSDGAWNSLSYMLTQIGADNSTGFMSNSTVAENAITTVVSAIIADGMSRVDFEKNGGLANKTSDLWPVASDPDDGVYDYDYDGNNPSEITEMHWSTTVAGLGYRANSAPYYLGLVVLFLHAAVALGHSVWVLFFTRERSTAWSSLTDLVALALQSQPPPPRDSSSLLNNTSGGIKDYSTLRQPVRIRTRVPDSSEAQVNGVVIAVSGEDNEPKGGGVQMALGSNYSQGKDHKVIVGKLY